LGCVTGCAWTGLAAAHRGTVESVAVPLLGFSLTTPVAVAHGARARLGVLDGASRRSARETMPNWGAAGARRKVVGRRASAVARRPNRETSTLASSSSHWRGVGAVRVTDSCGKIASQSSQPALLWQKSSETRGPRAWASNSGLPPTGLPASFAQKRTKTAAPVAAATPRRWALRASMGCDTVVLMRPIASERARCGWGGWKGTKPPESPHPHPLRRLLGSVRPEGRCGDGESERAAPGTRRG
jgi:hypothetical protein